MVAILENPEVRPLVKLLSVREYEQLGNSDTGTRTELIRGIIFNRVTPSPLHSYLIGQLGAALRSASNEQSHCRQEQALVLPDSVLMPDLAVVAGTARDYLHAHPTTALLVIEISISTLGLDHEKATLYAEAGIGEYWIVDAGRQTIEVHTVPQGDRYTRLRVYTARETLHSTALPTLRVDPATLFVG